MEAPDRITLGVRQRRQPNIDEHGTEQIKYRRLPLDSSIQQPRTKLLRIENFVVEAIQVMLLVPPVLTKIIPVIYLQANKDTGHNDQDFQKNRKPVLSPNCVGKSPKNHSEPHLERLNAQPCRTTG